MCKASGTTKTLREAHDEERRGNAVTTAVAIAVPPAEQPAKASPPEKRLLKRCRSTPTAPIRQRMYCARTQRLYMV